MPDLDELTAETIAQPQESLTQETTTTEDVESKQAETQEGETSEEANTETTGESGDTGNSETNNETSEEEKGEESEKGESEEAAAEKDGDGNDIDFDSQIEQLSNGELSSREDFEFLLEDYNRVVEELESVKSKPSEPEFPNERAKKAYEFLMEHKGDFNQGIKKYHEVMALDVESLAKDPKEIQFEAFALQRDDLPRDKARQLFEAKYDRTYDELHDPMIEDKDILLQDDHDQETRKAIDYINSLQEKYKSESAEETSGQQQEQGPTPEQEEALKETERGITKALDGYQGLQFNFGDGESDVDNLNFFTDTDSIEEIKKAAMNPTEWWNSTIQSFQGENGEHDYEGYVNFVASLVLMPEIMKASFNQGVTAGKHRTAMETKNASKETSTRVPEEKPETLLGALTKAIQQKRS
jgi:hypothetical protein